MNKKALKTAFRDTIPVLTGYLFLGAGFGILLSEKGYGIGWAFFMALFMFAGSGQYLAVDLLATKASLITSAIATLLVNARHLFYGISLLDTYGDAGKKKPYMIFGLTDETYSLVTQNEPPEGVSRHTYCFLVTLWDHIYWISGCVLGNVAGTLLPISFEGVEFVLTALFVTMFVEQWLTHKDHIPAIIGVGSTVLCLLIFAKDIFLIPSMIMIALLLTVSRKTGRRKQDD
ncbi:MAG: AzlC family ABC transporter permease [Oscillospiraceae bacterium]|nr:AzlC family ABC transporter permease [Oscillospiraceae bacterium]